MRRSPRHARELEVLRRIVSGLRDRQIADELCLSPRSVQSHVAAVLGKLVARVRISFLE